MDRYLKFDVEAFLRDSHSWDKKLYDVNRKIDSLYGLKELSSGDPVQTSNISNPTEQTALKVSTLKSERDSLHTYKRTLAEALSLLDESQKEILDIFFFHPRHMPVRIEEYKYKYGIERTTVYERRRVALKVVSDYILKTYF